MKILSAGIACALSGAASIASAAPSTPTAESLLGLRQCETISENSARLACFEREARALISAADTGNLRIIDRDQANTIKRSLFGFTEVDVPLLEEKSTPGPKILETKITSVSHLANNRFRLVLEDGAVWQTTEAPPRMREPQAGEPIQLERAAFGSYWLRIDGRHGVKGMRVK